MIRDDDILVAIDGAMQSTLALRAFTEGANDPVHQGLIGVLSGLETARVMILEQIEQGIEPDDGGCKHPQEQQKVIHMPDGKVVLCQACNEMLSS